MNITGSFLKLDNKAIFKREQNILPLPLSLFPSIHFRKIYTHTSLPPQPLTHLPKYLSFRPSRVSEGNPFEFDLALHLM